MFMRNGHQSTGIRRLDEIGNGLCDVPIVQVVKIVRDAVQLVTQRLLP